MERKENWYSVVRYSPDSLKGETINVGLILNNFETQEVFFRLLTPTNIKLKSLILKENAIELYKVNSDYLNYYIKSAIDKKDMFFHASIDAFYGHLQEILPKGLILSEPTFAYTDNSLTLFNKLMNLYIGEEYLIESEKSKTKIRQYVRSVFDERLLIDKKIKANAKIHPIKDKELISYTMDFVYKNGVVNLMQAAPSKDNLNNWFNKLNTFVENYNCDSVYHVLLDDSSNNIHYPEKTFFEMINHLRERTSNEQFKLVNIRSQNFIDLCDKIERTGRDVSDFEHELDVSSF